MKHFEKAFTIVMLIVTILSVSISAQAASKLYPVKRTRERVTFEPTSPVYGR